MAFVHAALVCTWYCWSDNAHCWPFNSIEGTLYLLSLHLFFFTDVKEENNPLSVIYCFLSLCLCRPCIINIYILCIIDVLLALWGRYKLSLADRADAVFCLARKSRIFMRWFLVARYVTYCDIVVNSGIDFAGVWCSS